MEHEQKVKRIKKLCIKYFPDEVNVGNDNYERLLISICEKIDGNVILTDKILRTFAKENSLLDETEKDITAEQIFEGFTKKKKSEIINGVARIENTSIDQQFENILSLLRVSSDLRKLTYTKLVNSKDLSTELIISYIIVYVERYSSLSVNILNYYIGSILADTFYFLFQSIIEFDLKVESGILFVYNILESITECNYTIAEFSLSLCNHFLFICRNMNKNTKRLNLSLHIPEYIFNEIDMVDLDKIDKKSLNDLKLCLQYNNNFSIKLLLWLCSTMKRHFLIDSINIGAINIFFKNLKLGKLESTFSYFLMLFDLFEFFGR